MQTDTSALPTVPFNVYIVNQNGEVTPKKIYTATRKQFNLEKNCLEVYILEIEEYIVYDAERVILVAGIGVN